MLSRSRLNKDKERPTHTPHTFYGAARMEQYQLLNKLGEGTFGIVYKGEQRSTGRYVAIKRILQRDMDQPFPVTAFREMTTLKLLRDDHIIELVENIFDQPTTQEEHHAMVSRAKKSFYLVFPYMTNDLTGILQNNIQLTESDNKSIIKQMLQGLEYMHSKGYLHRDIKASNILINHNGLLKIGDFGLARKYDGAHPTMDLPGGGKTPMTEVVMTRWYRAPEVLMGNRNYTTAVDLWASGCILGELYEKKPILPGKSDLDQALDIFTLVGEPNDKSMPGWQTLKMTPKLVIVKKEANLRQRFGSKMSDEALDLMESMLLLDHMKRATATRALAHPWLSDAPDRIVVTFKECHESDVIKKKTDPYGPPPQQQPLPPQPMPAQIQQHTRTQPDHLQHQPHTHPVPHPAAPVQQPPLGAPPVPPGLVSASITVHPQVPPQEQQQQQEQSHGPPQAPPGMPPLPSSLPQAPSRYNYPQHQHQQFHPPGERGPHNHYQQRQHFDQQRMASNSHRSWGGQQNHRDYGRDHYDNPNFAPLPPKRSFPNSNGNGNGYFQNGGRDGYNNGYERPYKQPKHDDRYRQPNRDVPY